MTAVAQPNDVPPKLCDDDRLDVLRAAAGTSLRRLAACERLLEKWKTGYRGVSALSYQLSGASMRKRSICGLADSAFWGSVTVWLALSPAALGAAATNFGPYNATFLDGGVGLTRPLSEQAAPLAANAPWSMSGWLRIAHDQSGEAIVSAVGDVAGGEWWGLALADGSLCLVVGSTTLRAGAALEAGRWYAVAAVFDGAAAHLYLEGREVAVQPLSTPRVPPSLELAPTAASPKVRAHFGGSLAQWTLMSTPLGAAAVQSLAQAPPNFSLVTFDAVGVGWPWQEHAWRGLQNPQDAWTLPRAKSPPGAPVAEPVPASKGLEPRGPERWALGSWRMSPAPALESGRAAGLGLGGALSQPRYDDSRWYAAVVPGTVLTTLIARGVYPDPNYGLNNLAIPDSLSRQDYWYRSVFDVPAGSAGQGFHADLQRHQLRRRGVVERRASGRYPGCFHPRRFQCHRAVAGRRQQCAGGARVAAASSRHSA